MRYVTKPGIQFIRIQNQVGGMIGFSSGVLLDQSLYAGFSGYVNLTHERVNTGIFGVEIEQTFNSLKLVHYGYNIFVGLGLVKDY